MTKERDDVGIEQHEDPAATRQGDDQEHAEVAERDGKTEVRFSGESRREKRVREIKDERKAELEAALQPMRESHAALQRTLQETLARLATVQAAPVQRAQPDADDVDMAYQAVAEKQEALLAKMRAGGYTPAEGEELKRRYYKLDRERAAIAARPVASEVLSKYRPPQGPSAHEQQLASDHPDVWFNDDAKGYAYNLAQTKLMELKAQGKAPTPAEVKRIQNESLTRAADVWGFRRPAAAPSDGQKQRFTGSASSGRRAGGPVVRQLSKEERELAIAGKPAGMSDSDAFVRMAKMLEEAEG